MWHWYQELRSAEPIRYVDIEAWARLTGRVVTPEEVRALRLLDTLYWNTTTSNVRRNQQTNYKCRKPTGR